jgi:hypothetical protein
MAKKTTEAVVEKPTKKGKTSSDDSNGSGETTRRGRQSEHAGKRFAARVEPKDCGRREGSSRYDSFVIISNAGKAGIKYEDYVEKGGDGKLINWFLGADKIAVR